MVATPTKTSKAIRQLGSLFTSGSRSVAATDLLPEVNREPNWRMALLVFVGVATLLIMKHLFHV